MDKRFEEYYSESKNKWYVKDTLGEIKCFGCANLEVVSYICKQWNKLYDENQEYKKILQELGLLHSDEEVLKIREELSSKLFQPLFKSEGIDVDIDITNGFNITPKDIKTRGEIKK